MSNPLIRPNDPRFQRQPLTDESGRNRFGDDTALQAQPANDSPANDSAYASPVSSEQPAYQPEYASGQPSRQRLIQTLAASAASAIALSGIAVWLSHWTAYPLLLIALPTSGLAWYTAADELSVIRRGGLEASHRNFARIGLAVGIACTLLTVGLLYAAIFQQAIGLD